MGAVWVDGVGWLENGNSMERDQGCAGEHGFRGLLAICLITVSGDPDRSKLRKGGFIVAYSLRVRSIMVGGAWWQVCEAAGHVASTVRRQNEECWLPSLLRLGPPMLTNLS